MHGLARRKLVNIGLLALALSVSALFTSLGMWQLDRAEQKHDALVEFESRGLATQVNLNQSIVGDSSALEGYRATATGHYISANILLDNQLHQGRAGYLVYSVFELDGRSRSILINHGWIPARADRQPAHEFKTAIGNMRLEGRLSKPPAMGLRLTGSDLIERLADNSWRVQAIDFTELSNSLGEDLLFVTLQLEDAVPAGFVRTWTSPASDEARHWGYAFQWFAMAVAVMVIAAIIMLRSGRTRIS